MRAAEIVATPGHTLVVIPLLAPGKWRLQRAPDAHEALAAGATPIGTRSLEKFTVIPNSVASLRMN
jgi:hypothetical protein